MLPAVRRAALLSELARSGIVATDVLAEKLRVSEETVRRDIVSLEDEGLLVRVHGGAMPRADLPALVTAEPFHVRQSGATEEKSRIGKLASGLLKNGDIVAIDAGTTAVQIASALPSEFTGVVATPSLLVAAELAGRPGLEVLVSGGSVRGGDLTCSSAQALSFFKDLHTDVAFLSSGGVSSASGVTDFYREEVPVRRAMLNGSKRSFVLAGTTKMERVAPYEVCGLDDVHGVITDAPPPSRLARKLRDLGVELLLA